MTSLCTLITVIVGLAITIQDCNASYYIESAPPTLTALREAAIVKIEEMEKQINKIFEVGNFDMSTLRQKLYEKILDFDEKKKSEIHQQSNSTDENIRKAIEYAKGKISLEKCTDNWEGKLKILTNVSIQEMGQCTLGILTNATRYFDNITEDHRDILNYVNEKKHRVEQCGEKYEKNHSVAQYYFAKYCIAEAETFPEWFLRNAFLWIVDDKNGVQWYIDTIERVANTCFHMESFDKFVEVTTNLLNTTRNCIQDRIGKHLSSGGIIRNFCLGDNC